jgi:hypothetical protein
VGSIPALTWLCKAGLKLGVVPHRPTTRGLSHKEPDVKPETYKHAARRVHVKQSDSKYVIGAGGDIDPRWYVWGFGPDAKARRRRMMWGPSEQIVRRECWRQGFTIHRIAPAPPMPYLPIYIPKATDAESDNAEPHKALGQEAARHHDSGRGCADLRTRPTLPASSCMRSQPRHFTLDGSRAKRLPGARRARTPLRTG